MKLETLINKLVPTLYEDEHLLAVVKPAGVDAGGTQGQPTAGLAEILARIRGRGETLEPANRLSRYESGVLLLGKEATIVSHIRTGLRSMRIAQEFVVVVLGRMREPRLEIGPGRGASHAKGRQRRPKTWDRLSSLSLDRLESRSHRAGPQTTLSLIRQAERRALIRCRTNVRSTHALRAQLRSVRLRLVGDSLHDRSQRQKQPELTCSHLARIAFHHPAVKSKITLTSRPPNAFSAVVEGKRDVERALHAALTRRLACIAEANTDSYRLLTGDLEGLKRLVAEKHGELVILQIQEALPALMESLRSIARWYRDTLGVQAVYVRPPPFASQRRGHPPRVRTGVDDELVGEFRPPKPLLGRSVPEQIEITERGLKFAIRPYNGPSVGLFLDHRDNRSRIRSMAERKDVLNLFAYTCGFSVAAAVGGADHTVSVDISPKHLEWGQVNFELNGLDLTNHQFIQSEAFDYLKRAKRQAKEFDLILLDPPSFAHGRKRKQDFSIARDLAGLITASLEVLRPGGLLMISSNYRRLSLRGLRERVKQGAGHRKFKVIETPRLPVDFAMDPDHAKTIFVRFE
ncbi:MAG: class I SAM-dependent methyltransferase [Phycisphaerae bacterium]